MNSDAKPGQIGAVGIATGGVVVILTLMDPVIGGLAADLAGAFGIQLPVPLAHIGDFGPALNFDEPVRSVAHGGAILFALLGSARLALVAHNRLFEG